MKVLLAVDRRFVEFDGHIYTRGAVGPETGERYLSSFDQVRVLGRRDEVKNEDIGDMTKIVAPGLDFTLVDNINGIEYFKNRSKVWKVIENSVCSCDCVIARLPSVIGLRVCEFAVKHGIPYAVELAACPFDTYWYHGSKLGILYAPFAEKKVKKYVSAAPFVSYVTKRFLQHRYPNDNGKIVACSNVIIGQPQQSEAARRRRESNDGKVVFGTIASLNGKFKGIQHSLKALALLNSNEYRIEYRIIGPGNKQPWVDTAEQLGIRELVHFDGMLPAGNAVLRWLDSIDVYLQPSLREGLPRALIEAMSRGCPAIASSVAGIPELLDASDLHRPGDISGLAAMMNRSLDPAWRSVASKRNFYVAHEYSEEKLRVRRNGFWSSYASYVKQLECLDYCNE